MSTERVTSRCTFCDRPNTEVDWMVAGGKRVDGTWQVAICDECVDLAADILREHRRQLDEIRRLGT